MSNVIRLKEWASRGIKAAALPSKNEGATQEELGRIEISKTLGGSRLSITGCYSDRLEMASFMLTKALNEVADRISAMGKAGRTASAPIHVVTQIPVRRELPRRLRQSTGFGELR